MRWNKACVTFIVYNDKCVCLERNNSSCSNYSLAISLVNSRVHNDDDSNNNCGISTWQLNYFFIVFFFLLQVSFSYSRGLREEWNVVKIDGFDVKDDPKRYYIIQINLANQKIKEIYNSNASDFLSLCVLARRGAIEHEIATEWCSSSTVPARL